MSRQDDFLREEDGLFGPGWDLAISLIAVLILAFFIEAAAHQRKEHHGQMEIQAILNSQIRLVDAIAAHYGTQRQNLGPNTYGISIQPGSMATDITISNEATLQRISFGDHVLFQSDEVALMPEGRFILKSLSTTLKGELDHILEIQIQGHADLRKPKSYKSNLELAARRAMTVYQTLQDFGIDPTRSIMSASSFAEYVPVARRKSGNLVYSYDQLLRDNDGPANQRLNRRIEVVLTYRQ